MLQRDIDSLFADPLLHRSFSNVAAEAEKTRARIDGPLRSAETWVAVSVLLLLLVSPQAHAQAAPSVFSETAGRADRHASGISAPSRNQSQSLPTARGAESKRQGLSSAQTGNVAGTVTDANGDPVPGADVELHSRVAGGSRTITTDQNGFYEIGDVKPGVRYQVRVNAGGFKPWKSRSFVLKPGQFMILTGSKLRLKQVRTTVMVSPQTQIKIATQQVRTEEQQRGFGVVPNFFTVYAANPVALTPKLKFSLALRAATDAFTFGGVTVLAAAGQLANRPLYGSGWRGFGQRFGADYGNRVTDLMIGAAILPSLLHQDPRYFHQGTGTRKSRLLHVIAATFLTRGDNGSWQPNYSACGGDLASAAISNAYYPASDRGLGITFENFGIDTAIHLSDRLLEEFVFPPH